MTPRLAGRAECRWAEVTGALQQQHVPIGCLHHDSSTAVPALTEPVLSTERRRP
jgi:hypothetical protein